LTWLLEPSKGASPDTHTAHRQDRSLARWETSRGDGTRRRHAHLPDLRLHPSCRGQNLRGRAMGASFDKAATLLVTSCYDGFVRLYDLTQLAHWGGSSPQQISPCSKLRPPGGTQPCGVAISSDGLRVAVGFSNSPKVDVLEIHGSTLKHAYSPDTTGVDGKNDLRIVAPRVGRSKLGWPCGENPGLTRRAVFSEGRTPCVRLARLDASRRIAFPPVRLR
jgi:hypothetical protein